eukprot:186097_1
MQDRLGELLKGADKADPAEEVRIEFDDTCVDDDVLESFEQLKGIIQQVQDNADKIKQLKQRANRECTHEAQKAIFSELDQVMAHTRGLAKDAQKVMKQCQEDNKEYSDANPGAPSLIFRENMLNTHAKQFQAVVVDFQDSSDDFKRGLKDKIARQAHIINKDMTDQEIDALVESKDPSAILKAELIGPHDDVVDRVAEIEDRHSGILMIEEGVKEVHELFNDLAFLVEIQGEKLQNIENNVMQTSEYAKQAVVHIQRAEKSAISARKKQCYALLCILIILAIVLIPVLLTVAGGS